MLAPRLVFGILGHTEKSKKNFPFKFTFEIFLDIGLSHLRMIFEKFHLLMGKIGTYQDLKISLFQWHEMKLFSKWPLPKHKIDRAQPD